MWVRLIIEVWQKMMAKRANNDLPLRNRLIVGANHYLPLLNNPISP